MEFSDSFVMTMSGVDATRAWTDIARMLIIDAACEACCIDVMATSQVIEAVQHACIDAFI